MKLILKKFNDLSNSPLRKKFLDQNYESHSNLAVGMGRVSSKKQKEMGKSDEAQMETIEQYVEAKGFILAEKWDVAETASKHSRRRNFIALLTYVRNNPNVKHIIFSHQSRTNRNRESAREIEALIRENMVTLHCVRDGLILNHRSPNSDWLRWDLFNNMNEQFIKDHTRNVMDGIFKRIEYGLSPSAAPFGYNNFRRPEDQMSIFTFNEDEAPYMRRAFELFSSGHYSEPTLKMQLDREFPNLKKKVRAKEFSKLLRNPFFYGDFLYMGQT
ncbi:MAG: hypothetical protein EOP04_22710, partial [Proteobacteria bacterium]